jgi:hypothetical protein
MYVGAHTIAKSGVASDLHKVCTQSRSSFEKCGCMLSEHFEAESGTQLVELFGMWLGCCARGGEVQDFEALRQL